MQRHYDLHFMFILFRLLPVFLFFKKQNKQHLSFFDGLHVPLISISWSYTISWRRTGFQHILVIFLAHRYVIHQLITSFSSVRAEKLPNCLGVELSSPDHIPVISLTPSIKSILSAILIILHCMCYIPSCLCC